MTIPPATYGKTTPGLAPGNAYDVNASVGLHLRQFVDIKETVGHDYDSLLGTDLKVEPFNMTPEDETLIKSAVNGLHTSLEAIDMTFINRLTGMW
jgi:hypothetical protein